MSFVCADMLCHDINHARQPISFWRPQRPQFYSSPFKEAKLREPMGHLQGYWAYFSSTRNLFLWLAGLLASHQEPPPSRSLRGCESGLQVIETQWALAPGSPHLTRPRTCPLPPIHTEVPSGSSRWRNPEKWCQTRKIQSCKWKQKKHIKRDLFFNLKA